MTLLHPCLPLYVYWYFSLVSRHPPVHVVHFAFFLLPSHEWMSQRATELFFDRATNILIPSTEWQAAQSLLPSGTTLAGTILLCCWKYRWPYQWVQKCTRIFSDIMKARLVWEGIIIVLCSKERSHETQRSLINYCLSKSLSFSLSLSEMCCGK